MFLSERAVSAHARLHCSRVPAPLFVGGVNWGLEPLWPPTAWSRAPGSAFRSFQGRGRLRPPHAPPHCPAPGHHPPVSAEILKGPPPCLGDTHSKPGRTDTPQAGEEVQEADGFVQDRDEGEHCREPDALPHAAGIGRQDVVPRRALQPDRGHQPSERREEAVYAPELIGERRADREQNRCVGCAGPVSLEVIEQEGERKDRQDREEDVAGDVVPDNHLGGEEMSRLENSTATTRFGAGVRGETLPRNRYSRSDCVA